jgi:hypothetical protein
MSYEEIPNLLYSGNPVYFKTPITGGGALLQVPMGVEGQNQNSPRSMFFRNILDTRTSRDYTFYDENNNIIGQLMDIGQNPPTNNDSYFFRNDNQNTQKGQFDVIYYSRNLPNQGVQLGGRRRKTRGRKGRRGRRTRRY